MKTKKLNFVRLSMIAVAMFTLVIACEKDDKDQDPQYVGAWLTTQTIAEDGFSMDVKETITFTKNSFDQFGQIKSPITNQWLNFMRAKGTFTVNDKKMNITVTEVAMSDFDDETGLPTGHLTYYKDGDVGFQEILIMMDMEKYFTAQFSITNDKLILTTDRNNDGSTTDADDTKVYTKTTSANN